MSITWARVHVGDVVRGADQRPWTVTGRGVTRRWAAGGDDAVFTLTHGERVVTPTRRLDDPVDLMTRADHTAEASALGALLGAGLTATILEEQILSDPFTPAAGPVEPKTDRWNRYLLPHPETGQQQAWTRVSTVARTLADEYGLWQWKQRMAAKGLAIRPDLLAGVAAADPDGDKDTLNSLVEQAMDAAESKRGANMGTAQHSFTQRLDGGEPLDALHAPATLRADLVAYLDAYKAARLRVEAMERIVCLPDLGVAGRFDRIVHQPPGESKSEPLSVLDLKTGKDISYSWLEIAIQQAFYAHAPWMWDPATSAWVPMPPVDQHRALVLHLPIGKATAQLYAVDIIKGWRYAQMAIEVRAARKEARSLAWLVEPDDPATVAVWNVSRAGSRAELAALWDQLHPKGLWTEEVNAAAAARWEEINKQPATV